MVKATKTPGAVGKFGAFLLYVIGFILILTGVMDIVLRVFENIGIVKNYEGQNVVVSLFALTIGCVLIWAGNSIWPIPIWRR